MFPLSQSPIEYDGKGHSQPSFPESNGTYFCHQYLRVPTLIPMIIHLKNEQSSFKIFSAPLVSGIAKHYKKNYSLYRCKTGTIYIHLTINITRYE